MTRHFDSLPAFLRDGRATLARGPVGLILVEDAVEYASTLTHHLDAGFRALAVFAPADLVLPEFADPRVVRVTAPVLAPDAMPAIVNACIAAAPEGTWFHYGWNAEYLFTPFCETRTTGELLAFVAEERRDSVLAYVVDLYADDLAAAPDAVSRTRAHLDRAGYYALARKGPDGNPAERQLDFFGGLRWRFEEHVPPAHRRIDRVALFRTRRGLRIGADHTFNLPEYNTYACPWHHSPTAAVCSFRAAKALRRNPGSRHAIDSFMWHNSVPFAWDSRQLMDLGLMEPGQWF
ncbi:MAG: hypothetical protein H3C51_04215 [Rubellimicrobium sp.]|nr:hypothetical protein [Rubellimicrobium sp.]